MKAKDETGHRYGPYIVLRRACMPRREACWQCRCECGEIDIIAGTKLRRGDYSPECRHKPKVFITKRMKNAERHDRKEKYGCNFCTEYKHCSIDEPCKYAADLQSYGNYDAYDRREKNGL